MRVLVDFHFYVKFLSGTRGFELGILGRIKATIKWFDFWSFDKCVSLISTLMDCKEQGNYALLLVQKNAENGQVNCHKKTIPNYKFCMSISPDFTLRDEN